MIDEHEIKAFKAKVRPAHVKPALCTVLGPYKNEEHIGLVEWNNNESIFQVIKAPAGILIGNRVLILTDDGWVAEGIVRNYKNNWLTVTEEFILKLPNFMI